MVLLHRYATEKARMEAVETASRLIAMDASTAASKKKDECHAEDPSKCRVHGKQFLAKTDLKQKGKDIPEKTDAEIDAEYLKAVKDGDTATVLRMFKQRARKAFAGTYFATKSGDPTELYHGTQRDFTAFKLPKVESEKKNPEWVGGIFFCTKKRYHECAGYYAQEKGKILKCFLNMSKPKETNPEGRYHVSREKYDGIVSRTDEPWEHKYWNYQTEKLESLKQDKGDIIEVIAFDPKQVKFADMVTYDDGGKPIPLSKRFDFTNPDMRY